MKKCLVKFREGFKELFDNFDFWEKQASKQAR